MTLGLLVMVAACRAPEGRWVIDDPVRLSVPLPAGDGPVYRYDAAFLTSQPPVAMRLEEELRIGGGGDDPNLQFDGRGVAPQVAVASDGRIFVLDSGNARVQVFSAEGRFLQTIGRRGQGPGEFERPNSMVIIGESLLVLDWEGDQSVSVFTTAGEYVDLLRLDHSPDRLLAAPPASFLWTRICPEPHALCVRSHDLDSRIGRDVVAISEPPNDDDLVATLVARFLRGQNATVTPAHDGTLYAMGSRGYEVARVDLDGGVVWSLRVDWGPVSVPPSDATYVDWWAEQFAGLLPAPGTADWRPDTLDALAGVFADERGNLYVFPSDRLRRDPEYETWRPRPVHVYNPEAELVRVGTLAMVSMAWQTARDGRIYGARLDEQSNEWAVIRSRLVVESEGEE